MCFTLMYVHTCLCTIDCTANGTVQPSTIQAKLAQPHPSQHSNMQLTWLSEEAIERRSGAMYFNLSGSASPTYCNTFSAASGDALALPPGSPAYNARVQGRCC